MDYRSSRKMELLRPEAHGSRCLLGYAERRLEPDGFKVFTQNRAMTQHGRGRRAEQAKAGRDEDCPRRPEIEDVKRKPGTATRSAQCRGPGLMVMGFIPALIKTLQHQRRGANRPQGRCQVRPPASEHRGVQAGSDGQKLNRFLLVNAELTDDAKQPPMLEANPPARKLPPPRLPHNPAGCPKPQAQRRTKAKKRRPRKSRKQRVSKTKAGKAKSEGPATKAKGAGGARQARRKPRQTGSRQGRARPHQEGQPAEDR